MALTLSGTNKIVNDNLNTEVKTLFTPKNWIINGGFDVWQRGTSQTSTGYGSDDRWANEHGVSTKTVSRQAFTVGQTDVPNNPKYFSRIVVTSGNTAGSFVSKMHRIEDVTKLAGKTVSLSFWAKSDANKNLSFQLAQNFGSGGSPTIYTLGLQKIALTTSWQRFTKTINLPSILGKTIGANNFTLLWFLLDAGSDLNALSDSLGNQSGTFDIANVSLVEGSVPVEWQTEAYADVLRQCQRYYPRFDSSTANGIYYRYGLGSNVTVTQSNCQIQFPVPLRITPTSIEYSGSFALYQGATIISITSLSLGGDANNELRANLDAVVAGGLTVGYVSQLLSFGNKTSYIAFNAEL